MIIIDDDGPDAKRRPQRGEPAESNGHAYDESTPVLGSSQGAPPEYTPQTSYNAPMRYPYDVPVTTPPGRRGEKARIRFLKAFAIALLVWLLFSAYIRTFIIAGEPLLFQFPSVTC